MKDTQPGATVAPKKRRVDVAAQERRNLAAIYLLDRFRELDDAEQGRVLQFLEDAITRQASPVMSDVYIAHDTFCRYIQAVEDSDRSPLQLRRQYNLTPKEARAYRKAWNLVWGVFREGSPLDTDALEGGTQ